MNLSDKAQWMALGAHGTQTYGDGVPYGDGHLHHVVQNLIDFGFDHQTWQAAGWLHDSVEDTIENKNPLTIDIIRYHMGDFVADLVWSVTGIGENRKARIADMHRKVTEFPDGAILKAADRIHNMESSKAMVDQRLFKMYAREYPAFAALVQPLIPSEMFARLYAIAN